MRHQPQHVGPVRASAHGQRKKRTPLTLAMMNATTWDVRPPWAYRRDRDVCRTLKASRLAPTLSRWQVPAAAAQPRARVMLMLALTQRRCVCAAKLQWCSFAFSPRPVSARPRSSRPLPCRRHRRTTRPLSRPWTGRESSIRHHSSRSTLRGTCARFSTTEPPAWTLRERSTRTMASLSEIQVPLSVQVSFRIARRTPTRSRVEHVTRVEQVTDGVTESDGKC